MSDTRENHSMPPGLKVQIVLAIIMTAAALLLPTALSANGASGASAGAGLADVSAGSVSTTTSAFDASDFPAAAFTDWER